MQEVATPSSVPGIFTVEGEPAVIGGDETRIVGKGETTADSTVIRKGDGGAVRVDDPRQLRTHNLTHG
jgi:hypothetical protein